MKMTRVIKCCNLFGDLWKQIREDWEAHGKDWTLPGFRAVAVYRIGNWLTSRSEGIPRSLLLALYRSMNRFIRNHYGIELMATTKIGRRFVILHQSGIVIHANAEIGDDCLIRQNVTLGAATFGRLDAAPRLGRGVQVGCGAVLLGKVTIGDGALIGPNVVVMTNVPAGATVVAEAPRVIQVQKIQGSGKTGEVRQPVGTSAI